MTGVPGTVGRPGWELPRAPGRLRSEVPSRLEQLAVPDLVLQVIPFFALALFAAAHWTSLVDPAQTRRALVATIIATLGGVAIALTKHLPRLPGLALRIVLMVAMTLIAVTAIGIRFKLLMPAHWDTLGNRVGGGLTDVGSVGAWPYDGPNLWLKLTTLLAAPIVLVLASALYFWPGSPKARPVGRAFALVLLVSLYGVAVAARPHNAQALRGVGLLACLALWIWLPRLRGRDAQMAIVTLCGVAVLALALTPSLASTQPWIDYRHWSWTLHKQRTVGFDWRHSYGPLKWPRKGTTMMLIQAEQAHYWKAETLDDFDGVGWTTSPLGNRDPNFANGTISSNPKWLETFHVTVRGLRSQLVVGPGSLVGGFKGLPGQPVILSNATYLLNGQLSSGTSYTARAYTPDPSAEQMRAAGQPSPLLSRYTMLTIPQPNGLTSHVLHVPLRNQPGTGDDDALAELESSRYGRIYDLARRVTAGASTDYDMVRKVGAWLEGNYTYSENVPVRKYPLEAFLFDTKRGYCQHFSGAAALMLRMLGVPVRVASGFAPGTRDRETKEYVVRDLDAHSWIEVWFQGIGWVPFDPTPALAPAASQAASFTPLSEIASAARGDAKDQLNGKLKQELIDRGASGFGGTGGAKQDSSTPWFWIVAAIIAALFALAAVVVSLLRLRRRRTPPPPPCGDAEVDHLVRLLTRLGLDVPAGSTLLELERRLERIGGEDAAGYARRLRRRRFGAAGEPAPTRAERRKLRHELASGVGAGPLARLHLVMPDNLLRR